MDAGLITPVSLHPMGLSYQYRCILWVYHTSIVAYYGFIIPVSLHPMGLSYQYRCILWVYHTSIPSSACNVLSRHRVIDIMLRYALGYKTAVY